MFLDPLAFAVIEIASNNIRAAFYFGLPVIAVEDERPSRRGDRDDMRDDISVLVTTYLTVLANRQRHEAFLTWDGGLGIRHLKRD